SLASVKEKPIYLDVPFTSQAPFGEWKLDMFQDACEEASMIMAMTFIKKEKLTPKIAKEKITAISNFEFTQDKNYHDRSAKDTTQLIKDYYKYQNIEYKEKVTLKNIIAEIDEGNLIIAPMNGQKLKNIYFTAPGPINHMLLIIDYDRDKKEFITNDPGTRRGKNFRYKENILFNALRDYPTGYHEKNPNNFKNIIIIKPLKQ
ncbi:MAG: C39 family peptidase, partial [Candidatus Falkowbacteria bacterium]|nr:C39 family peptidase [Candidatus Falkowbacteria bacterium]